MGEENIRPRIVIDTNVFVSGLISGSGPPARILRAVQNKRIIHLVSDPIVEEYLRVLEYPRIRKFKKISDAFIAESRLTSCTTPSASNWCQGSS